MLSEQLQLRYYDDKGSGFEYGGPNKISEKQRADVANVPVDEIDSAKFALFCKWLNESNFETKSHNAKDEVNEGIENDSSDDEFVDTNNETVPSISEMQFKETLPLVIEQANISSTVHEISKIKESHSTALNTVDDISRVEKIEPEPTLEMNNSVTIGEEHIYEQLVKMPSQTSLLELPHQSLLSLNLSCTSSASDLTSENGNPRRPVSHKKGRAPVPPVSSSMPQQISERLTEISSPEKEKKKKNLLTYIPSIFKPITPSSSTKNLTKETEI